MRVLALLFALISLPVLAADYTPWPDRDEPSWSEQLIAQGQSQDQDQDQNQKGPNGKPKEQLHPGRFCCRHCRRGEIACAGECLPAMKEGKKNVCQKNTVGCACAAPP